MYCANVKTMFIMPGVNFYNSLATFEEQNLKSYYNCFYLLKLLSN